MTADRPAAIEFKFADEEPIRSFIARVASAAGFFAGIDPDGLPEAGRLGVAELRSACEAVGASVPSREGPYAEYRGVIVIEWPAAYGASPYSSMPGRKTEITDALTGKPIRTCTSLTVHADMGGLVTAGLTLFAGEAGEPILDGEPVPDGDGFRTGVFPFLVAEMRVRES